MQHWETHKKGKGRDRSKWEKKARMVCSIFWKKTSTHSHYISHVCPACNDVLWLIQTNWSGWRHTLFLCMQKSTDSIGKRALIYLIPNSFLPPDAPGPVLRWEVVRGSANLTSLKTLGHVLGAELDLIEAIDIEPELILLLISPRAIHSFSLGD